MWYSVRHVFRGAVSLSSVNTELSQTDFTITAYMILAAIFFFAGNRGLPYSALFHYAAAGRIFIKEACGHFAKSHFTKFTNDRSHSLCCVPMLYTIVSVSEGAGVCMWGKLKSGIGWLSLDF